MTERLTQFMNKDYEDNDFGRQNSSHQRFLQNEQISRIYVPAKSVPAAAVRQKMDILMDIHMDGVFYHDWAESVVRLNSLEVHS